MIKDMNSDWSLVTSSVWHGSVLGPVLLSIFINKLDDEADYILQQVC